MSYREMSTSDISRLIDEWVKDKVQSVYIKIDDEYKDCNFNVNCWIKK